MAASLPSTERVVCVDFPRARRDAPSNLQDHGGKGAFRVVPTVRHHASEPAPASIVAVALLIGAKAKADTVDGDLEAICRLLRQNCAWSEASLIALRRTVTKALDDAGGWHRPESAAD